MTTVNIDGLIGWEWDAEKLRRAIGEAEDAVTLEISSPGGLVWDGLAMHNVIRAAQRGGKTITVRVVGLCGSIATHIACAASEVEIEDNAVWMIHNPSSFVGGDYRDMAAEAEVLEKLAALLARTYASRTARSASDMRGLMDDETYLYGEEIVTAGFADRVTAAGDGPESRDGALAVARTALDRMRAACAQRADGKCLHRDNQAVDFLGAQRVACSKTLRDKLPATAPQEGAKTMTASEIREQHPTAAADLEAAGVAKERARRNELAKLAATDIGNEALQALCTDAIADGADPEAAQFKVAAALAIRDWEPRSANAPAVRTEQQAAPDIAGRVNRLRGLI